MTLFAVARCMLTPASNLASTMLFQASNSRILAKKAFGYSSCSLDTSCHKLFQKISLLSCRCTHKIITCFPNKICVEILYCSKLNWTQVLSFLGRVHQFSTRRVMEIRLAGLWEQPNSVMPKKGRDKGDRPLWCSFWACFLRG